MAEYIVLMGMAQAQAMALAEVRSSRWPPPGSALAPARPPWPRWSMAVPGEETL